MSEPLVSVIMPAYNAGKFIDESIRSVIAQSFTGWELIVVDDGSVDNTKQIVEHFCNADSRIKYFFQTNGKQGKARNKGIAQARGKYIAFLDADDVWLPQKLEVQLKEIEEKNVDLVFTECIMFSDTVDASKKLMQSGKGYFSGEDGVKNFLQHNKIPILSVLMKADALKQMNGFSEKPCLQDAEDYHLWLCLLMNGKVFFGSDHVLAGYREHPGSSTVEDKLAAQKVVEALKDLQQKFPANHDLIQAAMKTWFKRFQFIAYNKDYAKVIKKNCDYLGKQGYNFFFQSLYFFCGFNITMRMMNKLINT